MSNILPKEKQTAYQRWELASFGDEEPQQPSHPPTPAPIVPAVPQEEALAKFQAELDALREEAKAQGHAEGLAEGRVRGLEEGRAQATAEREAFRQLAESFASEVTRADDVIAEDLLKLALDVAKAMLKTALNVRPELVLPIVGESIRYLTSLQHPALLFLHPDDAPIVREHMGDELDKAGWRIAEDAHVARGGCRVETASNQIDASIDGRWERIAAGLGQTSGWLEK
ncbi:MAG TPA: flagellar assembly protein FliH [Burkholderiaceae bacterium]